jgi:Gas vesicle synthesis protein GvpL/GvpF
VIYLYAIAEAVEALPPVAGIHGAPIRRLTIEDVDLVVSEHDGLPPAGEEAVLAHARVVEHVVACSDAVLPVRFGRAFADDRALEEAVSRQLGALKAALTRVRGCVELGVRVVGRERSPSLPAESGRAYMEARLVDREATAKLARELHEPLERLARSSTSTVSATPRLMLSAAYLVAPDDVEAFRTRVGELEAAHRDLEIVCTGPWPPYSFAPAA